MTTLAGRTAFVTGAARGLGLAIAQALVQAGANVVLTDVSRELDTVADELRGRARAATAAGAGVKANAGAAASAAGAGGNGSADLLALPLDVRDEAAFEAAFDAALARFGAVDLMVNNAGLAPARSVWEIPAAEWDEVLAVNLRGAFFGCRIAGRSMRARRSGRIVNLASLAGQQASTATGAHYAASKAGIVALTRSFALELAPYGVTVNALAPSAIEGPLLDAIEPARREALRQAIPVGRFGHGEEVAAALLYLASDAAAYVTGATLDLNGGRSMR